MSAVNVTLSPVQNDNGPLAAMFAVGLLFTVTTTSFDCAEQPLANVMSTL